MTLLLGVLPSLPILIIRPQFATVRRAAATVYPIYYAVLVLSIVLYRISPFHPLAKYPGPLMGKISKFWGLWIMANGKQHVYIKKLHEKYGMYVRVGEIFPSRPQFTSWLI